MDYLAQSDLACEWLKEDEAPCDGVLMRERKMGGMVLQEMEITSPGAAQELGRPCGHYLTFSCGPIHMHGEEKRQLLVHLLAGRLRGMAERLCGKRPDGDFGVLAVGLGNRYLTSDALGPMTVSRLEATSHLREYDEKLFRTLGCCALSAFAPGVLGETGLETHLLVKGAVQAARPDLVIAVDALAAHCCDRLAATVQLCDTGIVPGSGVGNHRGALTRETLGVPVISLGAPTVVNSAVLVQDALCRAGIEDIPSSLHRVLESGKSFFVSPKESDTINQAFADIFSGALSRAFASH